MYRTVLFEYQISSQAKYNMCRVVIV